MIQDSLFFSLSNENIWLIENLFKYLFIQVDDVYFFKQNVHEK